MVTCCWAPNNPHHFSFCKQQKAQHTACIWQPMVHVALCTRLRLPIQSATHCRGKPLRQRRNDPQELFALMHLLKHKTLQGEVGTSGQRLCWA